MTTTHIQTGVYYIQNAVTGTAINLTNGSSADKTSITGWTLHELGDSLAPVQLWIITKISDEPAYTIQNVNSRTFMDIPDNSSAEGTPIVGFHETGHASQRWNIIRTTSKTAYVIKNEVTGTFVDLFSDGAADGTPVNAYSRDPDITTDADMKSPTRLWHIIRA